MDTTKAIIDSLTHLIHPLKQVGENQYEWLQIILKNNPGLFTILITGLLLPIGLVLINNRNNRKTKELEKELEIKFANKEDIRQQEKIVYASLSKVLFDVQQLHVSLSGSCFEQNCITNALLRFDSSISKNHEEISNNMLFMSSEIINLIYKFYKDIGELKIELTELNNESNFDTAHVAVYYAAPKLAETIITIQEKFIGSRTDLNVEFDKTKQEMMKYCCGRTPPQELSDRYNDLRTRLFPNFIA